MTDCCTSLASLGFFNAGLTGITAGIADESGDLGALIGPAFVSSIITQSIIGPSAFHSICGPAEIEQCSSSLECTEYDLCISKSFGMTNMPVFVYTPEYFLDSLLVEGITNIEDLVAGVTVTLSTGATAETEIIVYDPDSVITSTFYFNLNGCLLNSPREIINCCYPIPTTAAFKSNGDGCFTIEETINTVYSFFVTIEDVEVTYLIRIPFTTTVKNSGCFVDSPRPCVNLVVPLIPRFLITYIESNLFLLLLNPEYNQILSEAILGAALPPGVTLDQIEDFTFLGIESIVFNRVTLEFNICANVNTAPLIPNTFGYRLETGSPFVLYVSTSPQKLLEDGVIVNFTNTVTNQSILFCQNQLIIAPTTLYGAASQITPINGTILPAGSYRVCILIGCQVIDLGLFTPISLIAPQFD